MNIDVYMNQLGKQARAASRALAAADTQTKNTALAAIKTAMLVQKPTSWLRTPKMWQQAEMVG